MSLTCLNVNLHDNPRSDSFGRKWKFSCGNNFIDVPANTNKFCDSYLHANKQKLFLLFISFNFVLKVVGNEKNGGSGRSQMLGYGVGPW